MVEQGPPQVVEVAPGGLEGRQLAFLQVGFPGENRLFGIDMGIAKPGFCRTHQAIGNQGTLFPGELAKDGPMAIFLHPGEAGAEVFELLLRR